MEKHAAGTVDRGVGDVGGNDLAFKRMRLHQVLEAHLQCRWKIRDECLSDVGIVNQIRGEQRVEQLHLAVSEQHRAFWCGEAEFFVAALCQHVVVRQKLHRTV